jgi:hypothetical protein
VQRAGKRDRRTGELFQPENLPLRDYAALVGLFNATLALFLLFRKRSPLPERIALSDLLVLGLAAQKISRVVTKDRVTSPLRAPFTKYEGSTGAGEVEEDPRGTGLRKAIGELITCPYCLGTWVASGLIYGFVFNPRITRIVASIFAVSSAADFAQHGYAKLKESNE